MATFVTAINCIDGRVQEPVSRYLKDRFHAQYVDMITCPGPAGILAAGVDEKLIRHLRSSVLISVSKHGSRRVAVVAHTDCAANNLGRQEQCRQVEKSIDLIKTWGITAKTVGLWVNGTWNVEEVCKPQDEIMVLAPQEPIPCQ